MNCPRCNMYLAQGVQFCPNCQLNLNQFMYQQQQQAQNYYSQPGTTPETPNEKRYRKLLVVFAIVLMAEFVLAQLPNAFGFYSFSRIISLLDSLIWMAAPLTIALLLPKDWSGRNVLVTFASIYIVIRLAYMIWVYSMYGGYFFGSF
jgi:hypothetical protein